MTFRWPLALLLLLLIPALVLAYLWQRRRKRKLAVTFSSVALIRAALPTRSRWRRHLPMALLLLGICGVSIASARPRAQVLVPFGRTSIILALDVSRSMCATDVIPNRLTVAQEAARTFVKSQPTGTRIGIIAFSGFAEVLVPPTTDKKSLVDAINGLTTSRGTAIGAAILKAIDAIAAVNSTVSPISGDVAASASDGTSGFDSTPDSGTSGSAPSTTVPRDNSKGFVPDIVVVLTDGANTRGVDPIEAAQEAVDRRVRVYTIGFGTTNPTDMVCTAQQLGGEAFDPFGGGGGFGGGGFAGGAGGGGFRRFMTIDEPTLQEVAKSTGGAYYRAEDAGQLKGVFEGLPKDVELQKRSVELSAAFAAVGALLAAVAVLFSMLWNRSP